MDGNPHAAALLEKVQNRQATIAIVGLGYVGLPTAVHMAKAGFNVIGVDIDARKVEAINAGDSPLKELELEADLAYCVEAGRLRATNDTASATRDADIVSIIVPTPVTKDKEPDLSYVQAAVDAVQPALRAGQLVVLESTTYPGTSEEIIIPTLEKSGFKAGTDFGVGYCPERYNPGDPEHTLETVHRVVGAIDAEWCSVAEALYGSLNEGRITKMSNLRTAEACKVIENVQRDLNIALVNELAIICEKLGIDVHEVIDGASTKWNFHPYRPGPGVGGHCLPVDPYYLTSAARKAGVEAQVILAGRAVNDAMPAHVAQRLDTALGGLPGARIACLGLAYKANTADARESPCVVTVRLLVDAGAIVTVHDPHVSEFDSQLHAGLANLPLQQALEGAQAVVLLTDHDEFVGISPAQLLNLMQGDAVLDTRGRWSREAFAAANLRLLGLGRP